VTIESTFVDCVFFYSHRATYITKRMKGKKLSSDTYLTETEPFLNQFALRSAKNQQLVGVAGSHINVEFRADVARQQNINADSDDGDLGLPEEHVSTETEISSHAPQAAKAQGMLVFFPGKQNHVFLAATQSKLCLTSIWF
jgi:hypothetical protein